MLFLLPVGPVRLAASLARSCPASASQHGLPVRSFARWPGRRRAGLLLLAQPPMIGGRCARGAEKTPPMKEQFFLLCIALRWIVPANDAPATCAALAAVGRSLCSAMAPRFCAPRLCGPLTGAMLPGCGVEMAEPLSGPVGLPVGAVLLCRKVPALGLRPAGVDLQRCRPAFLLVGPMGRYAPHHCRIAGRALS